MFVLFEFVLGERTTKNLTKNIYKYIHINYDIHYQIQIYQYKYFICLILIQKRQYEICFLTKTLKLLLLKIFF